MYRFTNFLCVFKFIMLMEKLAFVWWWLFWFSPVGREALALGCCSSPPSPASILRANSSDLVHDGRTAPERPSIQDHLRTSVSRPSKTPCWSVSCGACRHG